MFLEVNMVTAALVIVSLLIASSNLEAQMKKGEVVATVEGDPMYFVLPPGTIPAITAPVFVSGDEANRQMADDEPVLGIVVGNEASAYSLWQLDAHEIVNDRIGDVPIAVTW